MRPLLLRPPLRVTGSTSERSGSVRVMSSNVSVVMKRRPGEVGLYFLMPTYLPSKNSILSVGDSCTTAFFQAVLCPAVQPRRLGLGRTLQVATPRTLTPKSCSTAWAIAVLWALGCTWKVYL